MDEERVLVDSVKDLYTMFYLELPLVDGQSLLVPVIGPHTRPSVPPVPSVTHRSVVTPRDPHPPPKGIDRPQSLGYPVSVPNSE